MNKLKIFWKERCPSCPGAKQLGGKCEKKGVKVEYYNVETAEGLAEGSFYDVMSTPTLVVTDMSENYIQSWNGVVPKEEELKIL
ncbi:MAG: thioredoxin family protein [Candidatus Firestonebacteria bacterium]|nr:thioredoxin family protein [Candidatus Firestonebacteria bacterium]